MPQSFDQSDFFGDAYNNYDEVKCLRLNGTKKRLRRLRAFERIYYKKTCEVKKTGHNLEELHRLDDGNLRHTTNNLTYSLNKKKRWLLPGIIEQRICEYDPNASKPKVQKGDQLSTVDANLKIVMYENENIHRSSTCLRYGNSQTQPHVLHKNGGRFNSMTLSKWINFNTRDRWNSHHRNHNDDRVNQPNFGIHQRPGFFPSEVTYEFLYPKRLSPFENERTAKTSLAYCDNLDEHDWYGRYHKDTNKNRRKMRRNECLKYDFNEYNDDYEEVKENINVNDTWSIGFDESNENVLVSTELPIEYFIHFPSSNGKSSSILNDISSDSFTDRKLRKYFEPQTIIDKIPIQPNTICETSLCSIPCEKESDFLSVMQRSTMYISQANVSPSIFLQQTSTSPFSVVYNYCRTSNMVDATLKFTHLPPNIIFSKNDITLEKLIELVSNKLNEHRTEQKQEETQSMRTAVDALRGSLPLPLSITRKMILVQPNAIDKTAALKNENLTRDNDAQQEQWYTTINNEYELLECSICCEALSTNDAYQLLPCHHTLCHSCLTSYIRTSVSSATYSSSTTSPITCFEQNCSTPLNSTLLQAFVSHEIYHSYYQSLLDRRLFSLGTYRKCPSSACLNLLIVDDKTKPSLMCSCGQRVCSQCLEECHFPATCQQYKSYITRLRESGDHLLSLSKMGDNSSCYIAEGKNCPNCGEFVEKNGGCPHMTCKCGNEYCWICLKRWATHNFAHCSNIPESTHELRSSTRNRLHNKAINHRRQRNQYSFNLLLSSTRSSKSSPTPYDLIFSTYIDLNTLAEFLYVVLQRRRTDVNIRAVLARTAKRLEMDAFQIKLQVECERINIDRIEQIRSKLQQTVLNLMHMKRKQVLL